MARRGATAHLTTFVISRPAVKDLLAIHDYLVNERLSAADEYDRKFEDAFRLLVRMPNAGHQSPFLERRNLRVWTVRPYVVLYRVVADKLVVMRVVHGARDIPAALRRSLRP